MWAGYCSRGEICRVSFFSFSCYCSRTWYCSRSNSIFVFFFKFQFHFLLLIPVSFSSLPSNFSLFSTFDFLFVSTFHFQLKFHFRFLFVDSFSFCVAISFQLLYFVSVTSKVAASASATRIFDIPFYFSSNEWHLLL